MLSLPSDKVLAILLGTAALTAPLATISLAAEPAPPPMEDRIQSLIPEFEAYIQKGMKSFDAPGVAVGIVTGDKLIYAKGFGVRSKNGGAHVDAKTLFQIGSTTKAFLGTAIGIMVDRGKLHWDDRVVDLYPDFQLMDPWVTREFRVFDLLAQRSGLPAYANDGLRLLGLDEAAAIRSLRYVEPVTSFRTTFAYTNMTHLLAGRVVAAAADQPNADAVIRTELLEPLGMKDTSCTAEAIVASANHAQGYRWTPNGTIEVTFTQMFPYAFGGAGDINSNVEDMARWTRLQLANGTFEGRRIVSPESLAFTRTPKVAINEKTSYAYGWYDLQTQNGTIIWHDGATNSFGAFVGLLPDRDLGVVVLTNEQNMGLPAVLGIWFLNRILENPDVDLLEDRLKTVTKTFATTEELFARPETPSSPPPLASLAGKFVSPGFGEAEVKADGNALIMDIEASGAKLKLDPWNGDVFVARLVPEGRFADLVENLGPNPLGFVQFEITADGKLDLLRFIYQDNGQSYEFKRE
jgi:CubicO group peptidase (beta-lactamase class C family)